MAEDSYHDDIHLGATDRLRALLGELAQKSTFRAGAEPAMEEGGKVGLKASLGDLIDGLDERAYGMMLLLLALPCTLPFIYLLPQIVALPMLALAGQLALGRPSPWLPQKLSQREFPISVMQNTVERAAKYLGWFEKLARPRLTALTDGKGGQIVGALLLIPIASILVPLPLTNTTPGIGVAIAALGLIERDGLLILLGLAIGLLWVFLLVFFGAEAIYFVKDWLMAKFG